MNEEALREELYIEDKHREFLYQEKRRFDDIMVLINKKISECQNWIQGLASNNNDMVLVDPLMLSFDNICFQ